MCSGKKMPGTPQTSTIFCWVKRERAYKSKSCGPVCINLTFLKNSDKNTPNKKNHPHPIKGAVGRGVNIGKIHLFTS